MSTVSVYAFLAEGSEDYDYESYTTQEWSEAQEYAKKYGFAIIELEYEYADSSLIEDYRPGHALDGTPLDDEGEEGQAVTVMGLEYRMDAFGNVLE